MKKVFKNQKFFQNFEKTLNITKIKFENVDIKKCRLQAT